MEETKTITMPLSEYRRMEEKLSERLITEEENRKKLNDFLLNTIGMHEFDINRLIKNNSPYCKNLLQVFEFHNEKYRLETKKTKEINRGLVSSNVSLERENKRLKEEIEKLRQRKWYQFWKC